MLPPDYEEVKKILLENAEVTDVKRAAAFFKLIRYSYGSGCTSYSCRPFDVRNCFDTIWQASRRLADTVIENKDFEALIRQYDRDSAFFYCDPPIMKDGRSLCSGIPKRGSQTAPRHSDREQGEVDGQLQ